jgi:hypothetical protein
VEKPVSKFAFHKFNLLQRYNMGGYGGYPPSGYGGYPGGALHVDSS